MKLKKTGPFLMFWCLGCSEPHIADADYWKWNGDTEKPTLDKPFYTEVFDEDDNSVLVCHGILQDGNIFYLKRTTHDLVGQTIPLPDIPRGWG